MASWVRHGECNHCGHCCAAITRQVLARTDAQVGRDPDYYVARGFRQLQIDGRRQWALFAWVTAACPQHVDNRCALQAAAKPKTCREFPTRPLDVVGTPCSYWFDADGKAFGGSGSPHPATELDWLEWESTHAR